MNCITASSRISDAAVYRNGQQLFANKSADLPGFLLAVYQFLDSNYPKFYKMDNLSKLGWLAAEVLLKEETSTATYRPEETGLVLTNANSSLDTDLKYYATVKEIASPALFVYTLPNIMIGEICIRNKVKGESAFFISPEFDAGFLEKTVNDLMDTGILQRCICGWVDLLEEDYIAVLYRVEKKEEGSFPPFTKSMIHKIFQGDHE